jgi:GT2 family glycosyltransferase
VEAVESVLGQSPAPRETVVVIDHNDALLRRARAALAGVQVVANNGPRGLSGARNAGWTRTTGDVVAFLDDDARAEMGWIAGLLDGYTSPDVLGVGGRILPRWQNPPPEWLPEEFYWVVGCSYRGLPETTAAVRNLIGANMSFRRSVLETVDGFHSEIGQVGDSMLRCDDTEFCIRASARMPGGRILYSPAAVVRHHVPSSRTSWRYFRTRCFTEGQAKAHLSRIVGAADGLSSERRHVLRTLPRGVASGVASGSAAGLARSMAIAAGLGLTATGYLAGRAQAAMRGRTVR